MWKNLVQIVCSLFVLAITLQAKEINIKEEVTINIPYKKMVVLEFPFVVTSSSFAPFKYKKVKDDSLDSDYQIPSATTSNNSNQKVKKTVQKIIKKPASGPIKVTKGQNVFNIYAKKIGQTQLVVWGYSHPIIINLNVTKSRRALSYVKFIDENKRAKESLKFESSYHDKVIIKLTEAMYQKRVPKKYKVIKDKKQFNANGYRFILVNRYVGNKYQGEEYIVTNRSNMVRVFDNEIVSGNGVYGVTIVNDILQPGMSSRLFVVRSN